MTFVGHFDVELLINAMRILYKMYNKFSFYSIVVQTVAPEGSSATEGLKEDERCPTHSINDLSY